MSCNYKYMSCFLRITHHVFIFLYTQKSYKHVQNETLKLDTCRYHKTDRPVILCQQILALATPSSISHINLYINRWNYTFVTMFSNKSIEMRKKKILFTVHI